MTIVDLIASGKRKPGARLRASHLGSRHEAKLLPGGDLALTGERQSLTPSGAARAITGRATNGWAFWLAERPNGKWWSLRRIRNEYLTERSPVPVASDEPVAESRERRDFAGPRPSSPRL